MEAMYPPQDNRAVDQLFREIHEHGKMLLETYNREHRLPMDKFFPVPKTEKYLFGPYLASQISGNDNLYNRVDPFMVLSNLLCSTGCDVDRPMSKGAPSPGAVLWTIANLETLISMPKVFGSKLLEGPSPVAMEEMEKLSEFRERILAELSPEQAKILQKLCSCYSAALMAEYSLRGVARGGESIVSPFEMLIESLTDHFFSNKRAGDQLPADSGLVNYQMSSAKAILSQWMEFCRKLDAECPNPSRVEVNLPPPQEGDEWKNGTEYEDSYRRAQREMAEAMSKIDLTAGGAARSALVPLQYIDTVCGKIFTEQLKKICGRSAERLGWV